MWVVAKGENKPQNHPNSSLFSPLPTLGGSLSVSLSISSHGFWHNCQGGGLLQLGQIASHCLKQLWKTISTFSSISEIGNPHTPDTFWGQSCSYLTKVCHSSLSVRLYIHFKKLQDLPRFRNYPFVIKSNFWAQKVFV